MKRVGLFIGINDYSNGITPLNCARKDALDLANKFSGNGFNSYTLLDKEAQSAEIIERIRNIKQSLDPGDIFVFYFSIISICC